MSPSSDVTNKVTFVFLNINSFNMSVVTTLHVFGRYPSVFTRNKPQLQMHHFLCLRSFFNDKSWMVQRGGDNDLNNIPRGCREKPPLAQWQTGCSGREEVGLEGLEGSNVIYLQLFIHSRCHHVSERGDNNNRLLSGGHWGNCSSLLTTENVIVIQPSDKAVYHWFISSTNC